MGIEIYFSFIIFFLNRTKGFKVNDVILPKEFLSVIQPLEKPYIQSFLLIFDVIYEGTVRNEINVPIINISCNLFFKNIK